MRALVFLLFAVMGAWVVPARADMNAHEKVRLRSIDKITARTMTFDARVGTTIKFGSIYIKIQSCLKPDLQERPEAASFLQVWEILANEQSKWIFSGWMFASSPAVSAMDHPIYDVWVVDCLDQMDAKKTTAQPAPTLDDVLNKATEKLPTDELPPVPFVPTDSE